MKNRFEDFKCEELVREEEKCVHHEETIERCEREE